VTAPQDGPSVSALVVTRDRPGLLRRCLDHLRRQRNCRLEVVVVDDHSAGDIAPGSPNMKTQSPSA
jgi:hypothetical protein